MANPNIGSSPIYIYGNTSTITPANTSATSMASNAASSGKIFKINSVLVSNVTGSAATITINTYSAASLGGTASPIAYQISVPANATLIVSDKTTSFYLLEDRSLGAIVGTASALTITTSWEEINA